MDGIARGHGDDRHHDHHHGGEGGPDGRGGSPRRPLGVVLPVEGADGARVAPEEQDATPGLCLVGGGVRGGS